MADFKIGDKVRVIGLVEDDRTGEIIAKGDPFEVKLGQVVRGKELGEESEPEMRIYWWVVRLDEMGEEQLLPSDRLEKIE